MGLEASGVQECLRRQHSFEVFVVACDWLEDLHVQ